MKISELRGKTEDQLKDLLVNFKKESFNLRFQKSTGELDNTGRIRVVRRSIAKINTLLNSNPAPVIKKKREKANA